MKIDRSAGAVRFGTRLLGIVYTGLGVIGLLPFPFLNPHHSEGVGTTYLLNLVAINALHNLVHLAIGLTGLWASRNASRAIWWGRVAGGVLLALFAAGMIQAVLENLPVDQLFLGLIPLNPPGHILHAISGSVALYLGLSPLRESAA